MKYQIDKYDRRGDRYDDDFIGLCYDSGHASSMSPVSYTHLDVYKRQIGRRSSKYKRANFNQFISFTSNPG